MAIRVMVCSSQATTPSSAALAPPLLWRPSPSSFVSDGPCSALLTQYQHCPTALTLLLHLSERRQSALIFGSPYRYSEALHEDSSGRYHAPKPLDRRAEFDPLFSQYAGSNAGFCLRWKNLPPFYCSVSLFSVSDLRWSLCLPLQKKCSPKQHPGRLSIGDVKDPFSVSTQQTSKFSSASYQIQISLPSSKTILHWVRSSDLVQTLKLNLERRIGIPSALQRPLFRGKQLEDTLSLSAYSIFKNNSLVLTLRLRGGAVGQSSSAPSFSYKEAVHSEGPKPPEALKPKPFLVDKLEEVLSVELTHSDIANNLHSFAERAIICRFNALWPRSKELYDWIHAKWTHHCKVSFCSKGYFIVLFDNSKHYEKAIEEGPWFMGTARLFLTPWFPDFDPATALITRTPVWIRLPNLPVHLWYVRVYRAIGDTLGSFLMGYYWRENKGLYTYARICVELDLSKGLPDQINLKINDSIWTQTLDYENTAFRCRHCHQTGHLQNSCPALPVKQKKENNSKPKTKRWTPYSPPPAEDSDSSGTDGSDAKSDQNQTMDIPTDAPSHPPDIAVAQKRSHVTSSSDSDKEIPPTENSGLQVVLAHTPLDGWVKVSKKKGKKLRVEASAQSG